jgi:hypothetical protein
MFSENPDEFLDTDDFAVEAVFTVSTGASRTVKVIFNTPTQSVEIYDTAIEAEAPFLTCKTSDVERSPAVTRGTAVRVSGKEFTVANIADDGTGFSTVFLKTR